MDEIILTYPHLVFFDGKINGDIALSPQGESGFGYDPIFIPEGFQISFAQLSSEEKNRISHRALAVKKLNEFLLQSKK